jgi:HSP20 family protein
MTAKEVSVMTLMHWQSWSDIDSIRHQFDQLFDELAPLARPGLIKGNRATWSPAIEVKATEAEVIVRAELPGIDGKDLDVQVTRESVSISGEYKSETKSEDHQVYRSEFRYGSFRRVVPLPSAVQNDQVKADFKDGILTLTLPKVEADRPKVVKVDLNQATPSGSSS